MLPILRILPVGGVLLAIFILFLALNPPDGPRAPLNTAMAPARGALVDVGHHPETRQFLIMAALKRADELSRLRDLPDTPTRTAPAEPAAIEPAPVAPAAEESKVAGLPIDRIESDPEPDEPAATETPNVSIPVETGEVSAPELPVAPKETGSAGEKPEQAKELTKEQAKPQPRDTRRRVAHRPRRTRGSRSARHNVHSIFSRHCSADSNLAIRKPPALSRPRKVSTKHSTVSPPPARSQRKASTSSRLITTSCRRRPSYTRCSANTRTERDDRSIIIGTAAVEARGRRDADAVRLRTAEFLLRAELEVAHRCG